MEIPSIRKIPPSPHTSECLAGRGRCKTCLQNLDGKSLTSQNLENKVVREFLVNAPITASALTMLNLFGMERKVRCHNEAVDFLTCGAKRILERMQFSGLRRLSRSCLLAEQQIPHRAFSPVRNDRSLGRQIPHRAFGPVRNDRSLGQQIPHRAFNPVRNDRSFGMDRRTCSGTKSELDFLEANRLCPKTKGCHSEPKRRPSEEPAFPDTLIAAASPHPASKSSHVGFSA